jgi:WD40 repeat protein
VILLVSGLAALGGVVLVGAVGVIAAVVVLGGSPPSGKGPAGNVVAAVLPQDAVPPKAEPSEPQKPEAKSESKAAPAHPQPPQNPAPAKSEPRPQGKAPPPQPKPEPKPQPKSEPRPEPKPDGPPVEVKELAVLKGPPGPVGWLELSADGSRLATAAQGIVWDVDGERQVCVCKPADGKGPSGFGVIWLSADGQTALTSNGQSIRVWDGTTGNELFTPPPLKYGSSYTGLALSRDGASLALADYEWSGRSNGTLRFYTVGRIRVWDLKTQKEKWNLPGVPGEDHASLDRGPSFQTTVTRLAFSPDGTRLVAVGNNGLRIFALEEGKDMPTVTAPGERGGDEAHFDWLSGGAALVFQTGRDITLLDAKTTKKIDSFTLTYPRPPPPKPMGNLLPLPQGPDTAVPDGWNEHQITLSADGSRLAAHVIREHEKEKRRDNAVILWDVRAQRRVGVYKLADDTFNPGTVVIKQLLAPPILLGTGHGSDVRIALSGDGKRVAVADGTGTVRVYSTAQIEARTRQTDPKPPPITDRLTAGSVWQRVKGPPSKLQLPPIPQTMKVTERDGKHFKAELTFDDKNVTETAGLIEGGEVSFGPGKAMKGAAQQPQPAALKGDSLEWTFSGPMFPKGLVTEVVRMARAPDK